MSVIPHLLHGANDFDRIVPGYRLSQPAFRWGTHLPAPHRIRSYSDEHNSRRQEREKVPTRLERFGNVSANDTEREENRAGGAFDDTETTARVSNNGINHGVTTPSSPPPPTTTTRSKKKNGTKTKTAKTYQGLSIHTSPVKTRPVR